MLARQLQEKFDYELAQRLSKEERPSSGRRRNIPSLLDLPDMQPDTIPSSDRINEVIVDASRQSSSSLFSSRIPASFETDILYQMARRNPEQRANNNNNNNNNNPVPTTKSSATRRAARIIGDFEISSFDEPDRPQPSSSRADRRASANDNNDTNEMLMNPTQRGGIANSRGVEPFFLPHPVLSTRSNTRPTTRPTALATDPINNLASAFSILNNDELVCKILFYFILFHFLFLFFF